MIVGIGVDMAEISRLAAALDRTPALAHRLFADSERGQIVEAHARRPGLDHDEGVGERP